MKASRVIVTATVMVASGCTLLTNLDNLGGSDASPSDASVDGSQADVDGSLAPDGPTACAIIDGGAPYSPNAVDCFGYGTCMANEQCCSTFGCIGLSPSAVTACRQQDGGVFPCDEAADCDGGKQCCYGYSSTANHLGSHCGYNCVGTNPSDVTACKSDCDCTSKLQHCLKTTCYGLALQTCDGLCPN